jgi:[ribosomal protein S18]-alanine N-acetyltransferase
MVSVQIEPAQDVDLEWCARLMAGSEPWITLRQDLDACRSKLRRPGSELFLAWEGNQRLGFILLHPYGLAGSPYIASVAVEAGARGHGLGSRLVDFAEKHYAGRRHIFLVVSSFNLRAQELYRRRGYERVAEFPDYVVEGHSELLFHKKLP